MVAAFGSDGDPLRRRSARSPSIATPRSPGSRSSGATTPISPTTSGTSSTGRSRWPGATSAASGRRRERPPGRSVLGHAWAEALPAYVERLEGCLLHDALATLWEFVGAANRFVDAEQPWTLAKAAKAGDAEAGTRLRDALGDLVEACRVVGLAAAPFLPATAPRLLAQLGHGYAYGAGRQRRPGDPRRAGLGGPRGRAGHARRPRSRSSRAWMSNPPTADR